MIPIKPEDVFHIGVKAIIRNHQGKILILKDDTSRWKKYTLAIEHWGLPGGRVQRGNTLEAALAREVCEETGMKVVSSESFHVTLWNWRIPEVFDDGSDVGLVLWFFTTTVEDDAHITLSDEHLSFEWVSPREAAERFAGPGSFSLDFLEKLKSL